MKKIGLDSFRFSISWSRILPKGKISGGVNSFAVKFYNNLINDLLSNGIKPFVTLLHYDTPQALEDEYNSWLSHKIVYVGNFTGGYSATEPYIAAHHMLLGHAAAVKLYREKYEPYQKGKIGLTIISPWFVPKFQTTASHKAAYRAIDFFLGWFAHPITYGDYPLTIKSTVGERLPKFTKDQSKLVTGSFDFLGLNYYTSFYAQLAPFSNYSVNQSYSADIQATLTSYKDKTPIGIPTALSWLFIFPEGIRDLLLYIRGKYNNPPIYITENGMPDANNNSFPLEEAIKDTLRIKYHHEHLSYLLKAIKKGVNIRGYYIWCFLDDFEWDNGFTIRFGLTFVDFKDNLNRYLKYSAHWFKMFLSKPISCI